MDVGEVRDLACEYDGYFKKEACELGTKFVKEVFWGIGDEVCIAGAWMASR